MCQKLICPSTLGPYILRCSQSLVHCYQYSIRVFSIPNQPYTFPRWWCNTFNQLDGVRNAPQD